MQDDTVNDNVAGGFDESHKQDKNIQIFEDGLLTDDTVVDPIAVEAQGVSDDPVEILGVPSEELRAELDKRAFDGTAKPSGEGQSRMYDENTREGYEGTNDDLYNAQEDASDQASDELVDQNESGE